MGWRSRRFGLRAWIGAAVVLVSLVAGGCSTAIAVVDDGAYKALVPSTEQFAVDGARDIPGGFAKLRDAGIDQIEVRIEGDVVTIGLDGTDTVTRQVVDRLELTDSEGSGPFKAKKEVLVLGDEILRLGGLQIDEPVIWPGSFDEDPVITIKPWDSEERGPVVSCRVDEDCLLLSSGVDPVGSYENANNPELGENPIALIEVSDESVEFTLETGQRIRISRRDETITRACGLSETAVWDVPAEIGLAMDDPVLVHTVCPSNPGGSIQLVIMERTEIPVLAPLGSETLGDWCLPGPACLGFAPI